MKQYLNTVITGTGHYLPAKIIKNDYFMNAEFYDDKGQKFEKTNEEIIQKFYEIVGITERRYVEDHLNNSDMAKIAAEKALDDWGGDREKIDFIIYAHNFGDVTHGVGQTDIIPSLSARLKHKLGIKNPKCTPYDMVFGCPGWVQGMIMGHQFIQAGLAKHVLIVGSDTLSRICDPHDRDRMIFADGAGASIISAVEDNEKYGVLAYDSRSDNADEVNFLASGHSYNPNCKENDHFIRMQGHKIYEYVLKNVPDAILSTIEKAGMKLADTQKLLIHQANEKMDAAVFKRMKRANKDMHLDEHEYMPMTINTHGNSSVATVPTLLDMIRRGMMPKHHFHPGDNIVFASVGAGMNINCIVYKIKKTRTFMED